MSRMHHNLMNQ